jgi:4-hydroxybenzoate polyprenyltransferase
MNPGRGELSLAVICALAAIWPAFSGAPTWSVVLFLVLAVGFAVAGVRARRRAAAVGSDTSVGTSSTAVSSVPPAAPTTPAAPAPPAVPAAPSGRHARHRAG